MYSLTFDLEVVFDEIDLVHWVPEGGALSNQIVRYVAQDLQGKNIQKFNNCLDTAFH